MSETVEIEREQLATLVDEAQDVVDSVGDPAWHEGYGQTVKEAIEAGEDALAEE